MTATTETPEKTTPSPEERRNTEIDKALALLGITREVVESWKATHGRVELSFIGEKPYIYRPIYRRELRALRDPSVQGMTDLVVEEKVACLCTLAPKLEELTVSQRSGGLPATLAALIYNISDFDIDGQPIKL